MLLAIGDVSLNVETRGGITRFRSRAEAPGHGLAVEAVFEYRERYRRIPQGWLRDGYMYEYRRPPDRIAHHDHPPLGPHQHCRSTSPTNTGHYEDRIRLLEEIHEEYSRLHFAAAPIDCGGLRPLT